MAPSVVKEKNHDLPGGTGEGGGWASLHAIWKTRPTESPTNRRGLTIRPGQMV